MPKIAILFGALLIGVALFGYFGSTAEKPSMTALIPAAAGVPILVCGLLALQDSLRMHAMHGAAVFGVLGALAGLGRGLMKVGVFFSEDPDGNRRAVTLALLMGVICLAFVALCVQSFIQARKNRQQEESAESGESADAK